MVSVTKRHYIALFALLVFLVGTLALRLTRPREPEYEGKPLSAWLEELRGSSDPIREHAKEAIRQMGTNALPQLIEMLRVRDSFIKRKLMKVADRQSLIEIRFNRAQKVNDDALRAIVELGPAAKPAMLAVAGLLNEGIAPQYSAYALIRIGSDSTGVLISALVNTNDWTRYHASQALGALGMEEAVPHLIKRLYDPNDLVRSAATRALGRIGCRADFVVPALITALADTRIRHNVAAALAEFGSEARPAIPALLKAVEDSDYQTSLDAAQALIRIDPEETLQTLTENLASQRTTVRKTSAQALYIFGRRGRSAVPALIKCLKDEEDEVRIAATVTLRNIRQEPALVVPAMMENLKHPSLEVRAVTAVALGVFGKQAKAAAPAIQRILEEHTDSGFRSALFEALDNIDPQAATKAGMK